MSCTKRPGPAWRAWGWSPAAWTPSTAWSASHARGGRPATTVSAPTARTPFSRTTSSRALDNPPRPDAHCRPAFVVTTGQAGGAPTFAHVMARLRVSRQRGRPRKRPDVVLADKAYSSRAIREHLRKRGMRAVIPIPVDQRGHRLRRGSRGGRPLAFDRETYKQRSAVERCINRLRQWRGIATRYEKTAIVYWPDSMSPAPFFGLQANDS
ncbi:hypothetical protein E2C00_17620 [Streptomyces sp. WAC05374]|nr:hypothetical protein EF905_16135 [Streptomyces sp. WAC05374]TDF54720.1 hypothetical protein E2C00_17620 [Streptomyces sp. WAC05374]TDF56356.1 hypothetical protein E2C02_13075 [Streptomyces sp. WAC05374]